MPSEDIIFALLPKDTATVTPKGIRYKSLHYSCETAIKEQWFSRARVGGTWKCHIGYDPRCMDKIAIFHDDGSKEWCQRTDADRTVFLGYSFDDLCYQQAVAKAQGAAQSKSQMERQLKYRSNIEDIINKATDKSAAEGDSNIVPFGIKEKKKNNLKNIRENRSEERALQAKKDAFTSDCETQSYDSPAAPSIDEDDFNYSALASKLQKEVAKENE